MNTKELKASNVILVALSLMTVCLTLFAPIAREFTPGIFQNSIMNICLFDGYIPVFFGILTVLCGIVFLGLVALPAINGQEFKKASLVSGVVFFVLQLVDCISACSFSYDDGTLIGLFSEEFATISPHAVIIIAMILTAATLLLIWKEDILARINNKITL